MDQERRIALKFAYDGSKFFGFQRQPEKRTVEGALVTALAKIGVIKSPRECGYRSSSRTDRGVSALGNVVSLRTSFELDELCPAVSSELEDVWVYSAVEVPDGFNPRAAKQRWYRYCLPKVGQDVKLLTELSHRFVGIHDFSGYARKDKRNPMRRIDSIDVGESGSFFTLDFKAESFLWNMVRRIVWMVNEGSSGRIPLDVIGPAQKTQPVQVGLAPPEFLVLMDIDCGFEFPVDRRSAIGIRRALDRRINEAAMGVFLFQSMRGML